MTSIANILSNTLSRSVDFNNASGKDVMANVDVMNGANPDGFACVLNKKIDGPDRDQGNGNDRVHGDNQPNANANERADKSGKPEKADKSDDEAGTESASNGEIQNNAEVNQSELAALSADQPEGVDLQGQNTEGTDASDFARDGEPQIIDEGGMLLQSDITTESAMAAALVTMPVTQAAGELPGSADFLSGSSQVTVVSEEAVVAATLTTDPNGAQVASLGSAVSSAATLPGASASQEISTDEAAAAIDETAGAIVLSEEVMASASEEIPADEAAQAAFSKAMEQALDPSGVKIASAQHQEITEAIESSSSGAYVLKESISTEKEISLSASESESDAALSDSEASMVNLETAGSTGFSMDMAFGGGGSSSNMSSGLPQNVSVPNAFSIESISGVGAKGGVSSLGAKDLFHSEGAGIVNQVVDAAKFSVSQGRKELTLQLAPEELGQVRITLSSGADNAVNARFVVNGADAHEVLSKRIDVLQRAMESQGVQVDKITVVQAGEESGKAGQQHQHDASNAGQQQTYQQAQNSSGFGQYRQAFMADLPGGGVSPLETQMETTEATSESNTSGLTLAGSGRVSVLA